MRPIFSKSGEVRTPGLPVARSVRPDHHARNSDDIQQLLCPVYLFSPTIHRR